MNKIIITGKIEDKVQKDNFCVVKVRVIDVPTKSSSLIRCTAFGNVERYILYELERGDEVIIVGRLLGKTIKNDSGFGYYTDVRIKYISKLGQVEYGAYNE